eukprot:scaffold58355_cov66-Phaeocystis_antarctica.AAC.6
MATLPEPSSCTTSDPAASAWSRHTLVDFMMRPCALNTPKGITSMGVSRSNCCPNRCAALFGAAAASLSAASATRFSAAAFSAAFSANSVSADTGVGAAVDAKLTLPGIGPARSCDAPHPMGAAPWAAPTPVGRRANALFTVDKSGV